jgi:endoglucanase
VWSDRPEDFARIWEWTETNLQRSDGLLAWQWADGAVTDESSATDADTDTALTLLMAGKVWDEPDYVEEGAAMASAVWEQEVAVVGGVPYLTAGDWATEDDIVLNPSYLSPYAYRVFAEVDPEHDWYGLIDSSYDVLFDSSGAALDTETSAGLPPDWVGLDAATGELSAVEISGEDSSNHGYDAARTWWRVAVDLAWSDDGRAQAFLEQAGFLADEVKRNGSIGAVYTHDGRVVEESPSIVATAGAIAALSELDPNEASDLYTRDVVGAARTEPSGSYGREPDDIYAQEWAWFANALHSERILNLWHAPRSIDDIE